MKNNYSSINNLKKIRERRKLTLQELADKTGLGLYEIHFLESDRLDLKKARFETIKKLCEALETTPYHLFVDKEYARSLLTITKKYYGKQYITK